jgi:hypothetical protein
MEKLASMSSLSKLPVSGESMHRSESIQSVERCD